MLFDKYDLDKDGFLVIDEFELLMHKEKDLLQAEGFKPLATPEQVKAAFERLDINHRCSSFGLPSSDVILIHMLVQS